VYSEKILEAVLDAAKASKLLRSGDAESAKKLVESALKKVREVASDPNAPDMVAVNVDGYIIDYPGDAEDVRSKIFLAKALLSQGKLRTARIIVDSLRSEMYLEMTLYPVKTLETGLELASKYLDDPNKSAFAATVLDETVSSSIRKSVVIPIPLVMAEAALKKAAEAETKLEAEEALKAAKAYLDKAVALDYVSKGDPVYEKLVSQMEEIEESLDFKDFKKSVKEKVEKALKSIAEIFSLIKSEEKGENER
jgi:hypothetical protein